MSEKFTKTCSQCGTLKSVTEFYFRNDTQKYRANCKVCVGQVHQKWAQNNKERKTETSRAWRNRNREYVRQRASDRHYRAKYGISRANMDALRRQQDYKCAICAAHEEDIGRILRLDHCHATGTIRKLLCHSCNVVLGLAQDSPKRLRKMAAYLESHYV